MKATIKLLAVWMTVAFVSCDSIFAPTPDSERELPPLTTEGNNTFGCLINGEKFFPKKEGPFDIPIDAELEKGFGLDITAVNHINEITIFLYLKNPKIGVNALSFDEYDTMFKDRPNCGGRPSTTLKEGEENIVNIVKLDTLNKIVSGTFSAVFVPGEYCDKEYHLTEGRFDVEYTD
jgi:hypothetical protein